MTAETARWYNVLFSITSGGFTAPQMQQLQNMDVSWRVLNVRLGRMLIDIIGPRNQLQAIKNALTALGRDPKVICVFDYDGNQVGQADLVSFLAVANDIVTYDANGVLISSVRPTGWVEVHQFAGWAPRIAA